MSTYGEFFTKFMEPLFEGFVTIFKGLGQGLFQMFNIVNYITVINGYKSDLTGVGLVIMILSIVFLLAIFALIVFLIYRSIRVYVRYRRNVKKEDMLIEEIDSLNNEIFKLKRQNEKFSELTNEAGEIEYNEDGTPKNELKEGESRFFKLSNVDTKYENSAPEEITNTFTLEEFCNQFRNYSASRLHLYYDINLIRLFIASFASNKLIILEGISGTGKTSLAYAFGSFVDNETTVASVQPSWRDSTEIFGYFNEFTKKFNETEILEKMYEAQYNDEVYITLLDEMNISRVEYYFAEMLSILELPNKKDWVVELVPNVWPDDPKKLENGKLKIPENMWYIGIGIKSRKFSEGASTITQQLIKNTHLSREKTVTRKMKEIKLAIKAEKVFSKDKILEEYLNTIYFGNGAYGIENASELYFSKPAKDV